MPTPRPDTSVIRSAVEKPGVKMSEKSSLSGSASGASINPRARVVVVVEWWSEA